MKNYIILLIAAIILYACNSSENKSKSADTIVSISDDTLVINKTPVLYTGLYTYGDEVNTFTDCKGQRTYWVNDSLANMQKSYDEALKFLSYPYESVYAEVKGYLSGKSKVGYASEYENVLVITEIVQVAPKNYQTICYNYEFIALGNEPFWSLDIVPGEKRIIFKNAGVEKVHEFIYEPANTGAGVHRYEVTNPDNEKLIVVIRKENCSDGMSDRTYNYSAEITLDGSLYKGCAIKKGDRFTDRL